ncbi:MAG: zinc-dependent peptidase [Chitinophagaceae bacterium]
MNIPAVAFLISIIIIGAIIYSLARRKKPLSQPAVETERKILLEHVIFFQKLPPKEKLRFEAALRQFLQSVQITGVKTMVEDMDRIFIAAAAIIPIFAFKNWQYNNIHEILLYPGSFDKDYRLSGNGRDTLGMVGNGPMQNVMILSREELRNGFLMKSSKSNTAIHEFVHLTDKMDGDTDGMPAALLPHMYALPWLQRMHKEIQLIEAGKSDINPYAATNEAEFLAVTAEYFFEQPHLLQQKHPALYSMLQQIFNPLTVEKSNDN